MRAGEVPSGLLNSDLLAVRPKKKKKKKKKGTVELVREASSCVCGLEWR